jgi:Flp pilus assembly protein TadG
MSLQLLVIMVPVFFGLMGFAFDLGRLYLIRGELNEATSAMAIAAAQQLIGTSAALDNATAAAQETLDDSSGHADKYNFGALQIGQSTGLLSSQAADPAYFATVAGATGTDTTGSDQADGTTARHVQINVTADAPLLFWSFLSLGQSRKTTIAAQSVAGISSPLCTACAVQPVAIAALSTDDTTDFGFVIGTQYTFAFQCLSTPPTVPPPTAFSGTVQVVQYGIIDRDKVSTLDGSQNLYRIGADGLISSTDVTQSCLSIGETYTLWQDPDTQAFLAAQSCSNILPPAGVVEWLCGLDSRLDTNLPDVCSQNVSDAETLFSAYTPDSDVAVYDDYTAYTGNTRRVITAAVVDTLATTSTGTMNLLGFRQFLIEPNADGIVPVSDQWGRIAALYIGSPMPVRQGYIGNRADINPNLACTSVTTGPGKVVLHQ